jgi:excinuclease ABC subunit C
MLKKAPIKLPDTPGCYIFRDSEKKPIYVGKAKKLRSRVHSYFAKHAPEKVKRLRAEASSLEFIVTNNEWEAFLLENNFIKQFHPKFNILLRDDKTYPFIKLSVKDSFPKAVLTRKIAKDSSVYYGPFVPGSYAKKNLKVIQEFFKVATCKDPLNGTRTRPCLLYEMGHCLAPCVAGKVKREDYKKRIEEVLLFLEGKNSELFELLEKRMKDAAAAQEYESAAHYRDLLEATKSLQARQNIVTKSEGHEDYFALYGEGRRFVFTGFTVINGRVVDRRRHFIDDAELNADELFESLVMQVYSNSGFIPDIVILSCEVGGAGLLSKYLSERKGLKVNVGSPKTGKRAALVKTLLKNAEIEFRLQLSEVEKLEPLRKILDIGSPINRIEAFDVSHLGGEAPMVSLVVWQEGKFVKKEYRKFSLKEAQGGDDYSAIEEVVFRRYSRLAEENAASPDMILIDGGANQAQSAFKGFSKSGASPVCIVGLAKKEEKLYLPRAKKELPLASDIPSMLILRKIRDEAHRFAIKSSKMKLSKNRFSSPLMNIEGVGPKTAKKLLKFFMTTENVMSAEKEQLEKLVGKRAAVKIIKWREEKQNLGS